MKGEERSTSDEKPPESILPSPGNEKRVSRAEQATASLEVSPPKNDLALNPKLLGPTLVSVMYAALSIAASMHDVSERTVVGIACRPMCWRRIAKVRSLTSHGSNTRSGLCRAIQLCQCITRLLGVSKRHSLKVLGLPCCSFTSFHQNKHGR